MRPLAWLAVLCLALAVLALPAPEAAAVGVQRIATLLEAPVNPPPGAPAAGDGTVPPWSLAQRLLESAEALPGPVGGSRAAPMGLALGGVRFTIPGAGIDDLTIHARARRAVVSALRAEAARRGIDLEIRGSDAAVASAPTVLFSLHDGRLSGRVRSGGVDYGASIPAPGGDRRALLPALLSIALMILWRRPLLSLLAGLCLGAGLVLAQQSASTQAGGDAAVHFGSAPNVLARMLLGEFWDSAAWKPLVSVAALLATWTITARNGGLGGFAGWLAGPAATPRRAQLLTWAAAVAAPFEAPCRNLIVGWSLRTTALRARVSSEKFAWLMDSMGLAAVGLCALSPWTREAFGFAKASFAEAPAADLWFATLPWRGFCLSTLALGLLVCLSGRDFGAMLAAERRGREGLGFHDREARRAFAAPEPDPRTALQAWRFCAPWCVFVVSALIVGLRDSGALGGGFQWESRASWQSLLAAVSHADTALAASLAALVAALSLSAAGGAERGVPAAFFRSLQSAARPCLFLLGAWALAVVSARLCAPEVLTACLGDRMAPGLLPAFAFLLGAGAAYCFGSAWVLLPLAVPLVCALAAWLGRDFGPGREALEVLALAGLFEGTLAGALVSPWSFASLSASIGAGADHADHLRTQNPYALLSAGSVLIFGFLPAGMFGLGSAGALTLVLSVQLVVFLWLSRGAERRPVELAAPREQAPAPEPVGAPQAP